MPVDELNRALFGLVVVRDGDTVPPSTPARSIGNFGLSLDPRKRRTTGMKEGNGSPVPASATREGAAKRWIRGARRPTMQPRHGHYRGRNLRRELERIHLGYFQGSAGLVHQRTELTPRQREILAAIDAPEPPRSWRSSPARAPSYTHSSRPFGVYPANTPLSRPHVPINCRTRAKRLHEIADELTSGNDIALERGGARFVAKVPDQVALKVEF